MKIEDISKLAPAFACIVALAAGGCGATGDGVESQVGSSNLQGAGHVQGARGDGGWDEDHDVDEAADDAVSPAQGAAGSAPVDKPGRRGDADDADGGVDEEDCERPGFGGGFKGGEGPGGHGKGGFGAGVGAGGHSKGGPGNGAQPPQDGGQTDDGDDDDDSRGSRGGRR